MDVYSKKSHEGHKCHGVQAGRERIVHLANHKYNLTLSSDGNGLIDESLAPVNINDVVEIVSNPSWYHDNKFEKQNIIHDLIYAITRKTNNFWLITAEKNGCRNIMLFMVSGGQRELLNLEALFIS